MQVVQKNKITRVARSHNKFVVIFSQAEKEKNLKARAGSRLLHLWGKSKSDKAEKEDYENESIRSIKTRWYIRKTIGNIVTGRIVLERILFINYTFHLRYTWLK